MSNLFTSSAEIKSTYNQIASHFSQTRSAGWEEFNIFKSYLSPGQNVLDVGCGNGRLFTSLQDLTINYTGIDLSENLLTEAKTKFPQLKFYLDDMTLMSSVQSQKFDAIFFMASFHHLSSKSARLQTLDMAKKLLAPQGKIFMTNWNLFQIKYRPYLFKSIIKSIFNPLKWNDVFIPFTANNQTTWRYYHAFTPHELEQLFKESNLSIIKNFAWAKKTMVKNWYDSYNLCYILEHNF